MSRPLSTEDRVALTDLVHRYAALVDERQAAGVAALFTDDGVLATAAPPAHLDPTEEHTGREAIASTMATLEGLAATFHAVTGHVIDEGPDADTATGRVSCMAHHISSRDAEARDLIWAVTYRDDYRRTPAGWRFGRRSVHVTFVATAPLRAARGIEVTS